MTFASTSPNGADPHNPSRRDFLAASTLAALTFTLGSESLTAQEPARAVDLTRLAREMMPANVRLFVVHEGAPSSGSGTMVNTPEVLKPLLAPDEVLVISAGHVYYDLNDRTSFKAHVFSDFSPSTLKPGKFTEYEARCIGYRNHEFDPGNPADIAIIAVKIPGDRRGLKTVDLAPADMSYTFGDQAVTVGCPGGNDPIWLNGRILNYTLEDEKYTANITTIAYPRPGHSGGGLFNPDGKLIGVCSGSGEVKAGTIDFPVPGLKDVIISQFPFEPKANEIVVRSEYEADQYRKRATPDWAEFSTGRGSFAPVPDVHKFLKQLADEYAVAKKDLATMIESYDRLGRQLESQKETLGTTGYQELRSDLSRLADEAIKQAKKKVSQYRPIE